MTLKSRGGGRGRPRSFSVKPDSKTGCPRCPKSLGKVGRAEWRRVTAELGAMGVLNTADLVALTGYCEAWEEFIWLLERVKSEDPVVLTDKGNAIQNPIFGLKNKAWERMMKAAAQFGLTPSARNKLELAEEAGTDPFAEFLKGSSN